MALGHKTRRRQDYFGAAYLYAWGMTLGVRSVTTKGGRCSTRRGLAIIVNMCYSAPMLTKRKKQNAIKDTARHAGDTGSPEVQVGLLTKQINELASHLKKHPKDVHSRRGLLGMVADRRAHLKYLETKNKRSYNALLKKLDLKK
jgi:small subunit ribosomal protein S15